MPSTGKAGNREVMSVLAQQATMASIEGEVDMAVSAAATDTRDIAVSAAAPDTRDNSIQGPDDKSHGAMDMQWTGGTPVIEEPWPGTLPEYVPDHTILVPYFGSSGSHGS